MAEADAQKAAAALAQTQDAYIPNFVIGSTIGYSHGFPTGQPSVGSATMQSLVFSYSQRQYIKAARAGLDAVGMAARAIRATSLRLAGLSPWRNFSFATQWK